MESKSVPTIKDVASTAKVSIATVSKFINKIQRFSPDVEARITAAIKTLGYHSNPLARSMITGRSRTIGLSISDIRNPHFAALVQGANRIASRNGYTVLLVDSEHDAASERQSLEALCMRVDGLMINSRMRDDEIAWMRELTKPVVLFGRGATLGMDSVDVRSQLGAGMVARYLVKLGHQRIAYVGFNHSHSDEERYAGLKAVLDEHGLPLRRFDTTTSSPQEGARVCSEVLLGGYQTDAVVCFNDMLAIGFLKEAAALGFSVPQDCSVVGFDNIQFGEYTVPTLTSVDMGSEQIGEVATQHLIDILNGVDSHADMPRPELVLRNSTRDRRRPAVDAGG